MTRREALKALTHASFAFLFSGRRAFAASIEGGKKTLMTEPSHVRHFTANNPGYMTLQGTNQYVVGKENVLVIDVALSQDSNLDGIIEQVEAMGAKKIEKILLTHIHKDHCGG